MNEPPLPRDPERDWRDHILNTAVAYVIATPPDAEDVEDATDMFMAAGVCATEGTPEEIERGAASIVDSAFIGEEIKRRKAREAVPMKPLENYF